MFNKLFYYTLTFLLLIVLLIGGSAIANAENQSEIASEPPKKQVEMTIKQAIQNADDVASNSDDNIIDISKIKDGSNKFDLANFIEKIQEKSVYLLIAWIVVGGLLFFIKPKWGIGVIALGFLGYAVINNPVEIAGALHGIVDWFFELFLIHSNKLQ